MPALVRLPLDSLRLTRLDVDLQQILEIEHLSFPSHSWSLDRLKGEMQDGSLIRVIRDLQDEIVAYTAFRPSKPVHHNIELLRIAVHPCLWSRGLGRQLVEDRAAHCAEQSICRLVAHAAPSDITALRFLGAVGFRTANAKCARVGFDGQLEWRLTRTIKP